jgi:protein phosphatase
MGGHAAGELASATAVATLAHLELAPPQASEVLAALAGAIDNTGASIRAVIEDDADLAGMGTTVTSLYWMGERIALVHVGDSRAYLMRGGVLTQLTHDHTFVQTLIDAGRITEEEAAIHPRRSLIMRALDGLNPVEPDLSVREARVGDRYLLCSDGLSGVMSIDEIAERMRDGDPTGSVTRLVEFALERGAPDNVTVVIADVVDGDGSGEDNVSPVVVGAAGEPRVRVRLPNVAFPDDAQRDPDRADGGALGRASVALPAGRLDGESPPHRHRRWRLILVLGLLVASTVTALLVAQNWLHSRWYVAINGSPGTGTISIYNGVQGSMLGFNLSTVSVDSGLTVGSLPFFDQELVSKGIPASDETDAQRIVSELKDRAAACAAPFAPSGCPGVAP